MIKKLLENRDDLYNIAIIEKMYSNGDVVAKLQQVETDEEGVETIIKQDTNIVFESGSFEFTQEEINELNN